MLKSNVLLLNLWILFGVDVYEWKMSPVVRSFVRCRHLCLVSCLQNEALLVYNQTKLIGQLQQYDLKSNDVHFG